MTPRLPRLAAGALAGGLLLTPLAGCSGGSDALSCSGSSCTVTLTGDGSKVSVLGQELAYAGTHGGRATLSVGDAGVSCAQGESVSAGPLRLECTSVTDSGVELRASLG
jgi:hypothetical protein